MKDVDWFEKNLSHDSIMVEVYQPLSIGQPLKETEIEKSLPGEELEDNSNSSPRFHAKTTPFTNLPITVDQERFIDLRRRDLMAALRLVFENKSSILTSTQVTPPSTSNDPPTVSHDQILQQFKAKILNVNLV